MFKSIIVAATSLLGASLVYAATNLTITIVPPGSVPDPSTPAPAVAAGFTTLVIDYDFTQSSPWSDRNSWLRCHDGSGASSPLMYQNWVGFGQFQMPPCSNVRQAIDPLGSPALNLHMDHAIFSAMGCEPNCNNAVTAVPLETVDDVGNGNLIPANSYIEVTALPTSSDPSMTHLFADLWSFPINAGVEWDGIEWFGNNIGFTTYHNNSSGYVHGTNQADSMDQSNYHTYAWRVTSNGSFDGFFCSYKDNAPAASSPDNCVSWHPTAGQASGAITGTVQFMTGFAGCGVGPPNCPNSSVDLWVRRLRVWSCAGLNSGAQCFTSSANP